jgi:hypothetical protein
MLIIYTNKVMIRAVYGECYATYDMPCPAQAGVVQSLLVRMAGMQVAQVIQMELQAQSKGIRRTIDPFYMADVKQPSRPSTTTGRWSQGTAGTRSDLRCFQSQRQARPVVRLSVPQCRIAAKCSTTSPNFSCRCASCRDSETIGGRVTIVTLLFISDDGHAFFFVPACASW